MKKILTAIMIGGACLVISNFSAADEMTRRVLCESEGFAPQSCYLPELRRDAVVEDVRMMKQLSSKPCVEGKSWTANDAEIIVRNGCRAEFLVTYKIFDRSQRHERWDRRSDSRHRYRSPLYAEDPTDIVIRSFEDIYDRRPSREELRFYRSLIIDRGWTERQIRDDLRSRGRSRGRW
jgi:hypothetical protein